MVDAEQIFFLTPVEYALLLAGKGVRQHYTLQADEVKMEEAEICCAMTHLYQTGLIDSNSETFFVREDLDKLLVGIKEAEYILCIRFGRHEKRDFCCFGGKAGYTGLRLSRIDENSYEIFHTDGKRIQQELIRSLETKQVYEPVLEEEKCYQEIRNSRQSISREVIRRYHNLLVSVERIHPTSGNVKKRFLIRFSDTGICCDAAWKAYGSESLKKSDMEDIKKILTQMMESGED